MQPVWTVVQELTLAQTFATSRFRGGGCILRGRHLLASYVAFGTTRPSPIQRLLQAWPTNASPHFLNFLKAAPDGYFMAQLKAALCLGWGHLWHSWTSSVGWTVSFNSTRFHGGHKLCRPRRPPKAAAPHFGTSQLWLARCNHQGHMLPCVKMPSGIAAQRVVSASWINQTQSRFLLVIVMKSSRLKSCGS